MKKEVEYLKKEVKKGLEVNDAITQLDQLDFSITETMKFLISEYKISLREAKELVSEHPAWSSLVTETAPAHNKIIRALTSDDITEAVKSTGND